MTSKVEVFHIKPIHKDERRDLTEIFNGIFEAKQLKMLKINKDSILGNHYHPYRQFFYMLKGKAEYCFQDILTAEKFEFDINKGDLVIIEGYIAHKAKQKKGNIMIEGNEEKYSSPQIDDLKWEIK